MFVWALGLSPEIENSLRYGFFSFVGGGVVEVGAGG
jgi:hypothetical protein